MIEYERGCPKRVNHFLKVYSFAKIICQNEKIAKELQLIVEAASIIHDVGIKVSLEKYNSSSGKYQQIEGPQIAQKILNELGAPKDLTDRICFLIANHHTYDKIDGIDYQILIEADFLVNIFEDNLNRGNILNIKNKYFKTITGIKLLEKLYLV
jgi:HD superfamily phosphodiesterase